MRVGGGWRVAGGGWRVARSVMSLLVLVLVLVANVSPKVKLQFKRTLKVCLLGSLEVVYDAYRVDGFTVV